MRDSISTQGEISRKIQNDINDIYIVDIMIHESLKYFRFCVEKRVPMCLKIELFEN